VALALAPASAVAASSAGKAPASTPTLTADPITVQPGEAVTLEGSGFARNAHVSLLAGPPHGTTSRIGGAETGRGGHFVATIRIRPRSSADVLVVRACQDACRVKATVRFRIVAP